jgi:hypothetical protein
MAWFKYQKFLTPLNDAAFDQVIPVGHATPISGIYRCVGCGLDITSVKDHTMPPQNLHQHPHNLGDVGWQLIVMSTHHHEH